MKGRLQEGHGPAGYVVPRHGNFESAVPDRAAGVQHNGLAVVGHTPTLLPETTEDFGPRWESRQPLGEVYIENHAAGLRRGDSSDRLYWPAEQP